MQVTRPTTKDNLLGMGYARRINNPGYRHAEKIRQQAMEHTPLHNDTQKNKRRKDNKRWAALINIVQKITQEKMKVTIVLIIHGYSEKTKKCLDK